MKVKQFTNEPWEIESQINNWLKGEDVEITNVQYSISAANDDGFYASCLIFYQERYEHNMKNTEW